MLPYVVLVLVLAIAGGLGWVVYGTTVFAADSIQVEGATTVSAAQIEQAANVPANVPLAQLDTAAIAGRVRALAPVAGARVTRSWPSTVTIVVRERVAVAVSARDGGFVLMDREGVPFRSVTARPPGLPEIRVDRPAPGDASTRAAIAVARGLSADLRGKLRRITAPTPEQVTLELADGRTVFWGDSENNDRKATVTAALLHRPGKRIDVSAPDVVTVK